MRSSWVSWILAALLVVGLGFGLWTTWQPSLEAQPADVELTDARVTRVVDGDTIEVAPQVQGTEDVRLIGVDTPEVFGGEEPCGPEASAFTTEQLEGQAVQLEFDEDRTDRFDRALAYVWQGEELFNETLVREGLARVLTIAPNDKYADRFQTAQSEAEAEGVNLWDPAGPCTTSGPSPETTTPSAPEPAPQPAPSQRELAPTPRETPRGGSGLMEAGGPMEPPYPTMMDGSCPEEFPVQRADGCYPR